MQARQIALASKANLLFHPSGSIMQAYDVTSGQQKYILRGHMDAVNACCFNKVTQDLYTGANDHQICVWTFPRNQEDHEDSWSP